MIESRCHMFARLPFSRPLEAKPARRGQLERAASPGGWVGVL